MAIIKKKTIGEDMEKLEPSFIAGGNVKWWSHIGKQTCSSLEVNHSYHLTQQLWEMTTLL